MLVVVRFICTFYISCLLSFKYLIPVELDVIDLLLRTIIISMESSGKKDRNGSWIGTGGDWKIMEEDEIRKDMTAALYMMTCKGKEVEVNPKCDISIDRDGNAINSQPYQVLPHWVLADNHNPSMFSDDKNKNGISIGLICRHLVAMDNVNHLGACGLYMVEIKGVIGKLAHTHVC